MKHTLMSGVARRPVGFKMRSGKDRCSPPRLFRTTVAAVSILLAGTSLVACGSSKTSSSSATSATSASSPTSASASSPTSVSSGTAPATGSTASAQVAAANAFLKPYLLPPTSLALTTPLRSAAPRGKTLVWLNCDSPQCPETESFIKAATDAVGWTLKSVQYQTANPATLTAALQQALQYHPVAVTFVAQPYAVWQSMVPVYKKAGVAIIPENVGVVPLSPTVPANISGPAFFTLTGKIMANWFIADSGAKGHVLLYSIPQLGSILYTQQVIQQTIKAGCTACKLTLLAQPFSEVAAGKNVPSIVSAVQKDTSIKYVLSIDQALNAALPSTLNADGIKGIKVAGTSVEASDEQAIKQGTVAAGTPDSSNFVGWAIVDAALRLVEGMSQPTDNSINAMLITPSSPITPSNSFNYPANWQEQFKKLWKIG